MAVDTTIPSSSNNVGDDLSAIQENFELLASAQVVDEGSTADGDYIRYENGWQVCIKYETVDMTNSDPYSIDFPVDFNDDNAAQWYISGHNTSSARADEHASLYGGRGLESSLRGGAHDGASWRFSRENDSDAPTEVPITLFAIGRWK